MENKINEIKEKALNEIEEANDLQSLDNVRIK